MEILLIGTTGRSSQRQLLRLARTDHRVGYLGHDARRFALLPSSLPKTLRSRVSVAQAAG